MDICRIAFDKLKTTSKYSNWFDFSWLKLGEENQRTLNKSGERGRITGAGTVEARWRQRSKGRRRGAEPEAWAQQAVPVSVTKNGCNVSHLGLCLSNRSLVPPPRRPSRLLHFPSHWKGTCFMSFNFLSFFPLSFCISCLNLHVFVSGYFSFFFLSENAKETKRSTNGSQK